MRTSFIVVLALSVAALVGISTLFVTSAATGRPIMFGQQQSQSNGNGGMMGSFTEGGGKMGGSYGNGGMMGGGGGMMGNSYNGSYMGQMMGGLANGNLTSSYMGKMMDAYGNLSSWCFQYMSKYFGQGQIWNSTAGSGHAMVMIADYAFYPANVTIQKGTTVTWVNMDFVVHTVTSGSEQSPTNLFDSHELSHMQSFSYTFATPGVYHYYCDVHPGMVGTITVT